MENINPVDQLAKYYSEHPIVRAGAQFIPKVGAFDVLLTERANELAKKRAALFFKELAKTGAVLTPDVVQSEDYVHRFVITAKAAVNTQRAEKIEQFARLLTSSYWFEKAITTDEYEEYLKILDDLSVREIGVLALIGRCQILNPYIPEKGEKPNELQIANAYWDVFISEMQNVYGINEEETQTILARLQRTGCYRAITGSYYNYSGDRGQLTSLYFKIRDLVYPKQT